jgi:RHS repeat-associated protein
MNKYFFKTIIIVSLTFLLGLRAFAQEGELASEAPEAGEGEVTDATGVSNASFEPDYFTGASTYRINIDLPPGRAGMTPQLRLVYNSHRRSQDGIVGLGWELNESYIQRSLVDGTPDYQGNDYVLHENGQEQQLLRTGWTRNDCAELLYKVETPGQRRFFKCADHWDVYDMSGHHYVFGTQEARLSDQEATKVYRWYLHSVEDLNGNRIRYSYLGQNSRYALTDDDFELSSLVPQSIRYTAFRQEEVPFFQVDFSYDVRAATHPNFRPGFGHFLPLILSNIRIRTREGETIKNYSFDYHNDQGQLLLEGVQVTAGEGDESIVVPERRFSYATLRDEDYWQDRQANYSDPASQSFFIDQDHLFVDLDGDGLLDRVVADRQEALFRMYRNTGTGFDDEPDIWRDICGGAFCGGLVGDPQGDRTAIIDMNGDGLADRIIGGQRRVDGRDYRGYFVQFNNGHRWRWGETWDDPLCEDGEDLNDECGRMRFQDMNGDGLPDRFDYDLEAEQYRVFLNQGHGFAENAENWDDPSVGRLGPLSQKDLFDINGDGLPDILIRRIDLPAVPFVDVYYNTGHGWFESFDRWDYPRHLIDNRIHSFLKDVNKDGRPDLVAGDPDQNQILIYYNTGSGFKLDRPVTIQDPILDDRFRGHIEYFENDRIFPGLLDLNGDGYPDRIAPINDARYDVHLTRFRIPDSNYYAPPQVMTQIDNGMGVVTELRYRPTTRLKNRLLPFNLFVLSELIVREGAEEKLTQIDYAGGQFFTDWSNVVGRKYNGFHFVRISDHLGNLEHRWYHQANDVVEGNLFVVDDVLPDFILEGHVDTRDVLNDRILFNGAQPWRDAALSGRMYRRTQYIRKPGVAGLIKFRTQQWDWEKSYNHPRDLNRRLFVWLDQETVTDYEGFENGLSRSTEYEYDHGTGQLLERASGGHDRDINRLVVPKKTRFAEYATFETPYGNLPSAKPQRVTHLEGEIERNVTRFSYDQRLNIMEKLEELRYLNNFEARFATRFERDRYGNVTQLTDPRGVIVQTLYDLTTHTYPRRTSIANNYVTETEYDQRFGRVLRKQTPDGRVLSRRYDALGRLAEEQFQDRWRERFEYIEKLPRDDGSGRFLSVVKHYTNIDSDPGSRDLPREVRYYDGQRRLVQSSIKSERSNRSYRTSQNFFVQMRDRNEESRTEPRFTANSDFLNRMGPQRESLTVKDSRGRPHQLIPPIGDQFSPTGPTLYRYGFGGDPWARVIIDPEDKETREFFDTWGNKVNVTNILNNRQLTTRYSYDFWDNMILISDSEDNQTRFVYDNLGRKRQSVDPDSGTRDFDYDAVGQVIEQRDALGQRQEWDYDALGRLTHDRSFGSGGDRLDEVRYLYDQARDENGEDLGNQYRIRRGELFAVIDAAGWVRLSYDNWGNINKTTRKIDDLESPLQTLYTRDADGRILEMDYPRARVHLAYQYDRAANIRRVEETRSNTWLYFINPDTDYDVFGHVLKERFGNGTENVFEYFPSSHRLLRSTTRLTEEPDTRYRSIHYNYDRVRNVVGIFDDLNGPDQDTSIVNIQFDDLHRLTSYQTRNAWEDRNQVTYRYDDIGNILQNEESFGNTPYRYEGAHRLLSVGNDEFLHDANGNVTRGRGRSYTYNARDQLTEVVLQNAWQAHYQYDYSGQRVSKLVDKGNNESSRTFYLNNIFEVREGQLIHNIFAGNQLVAVIARGRIDEQRAPPPENPSYRFREDVDDDWPHPTEDFFYYVHADYLGSSNLMTEGMERATHGGLRYRKGELVQRIEYTPFGQERYVFNPALEEGPKYTGQIHDIDTDLYYYNARYYDPVLGRFIQADSVIPNVYQPQGLNHYSYVINNPLRYVDPTGYYYDEGDEGDEGESVSASEDSESTSSDNEGDGTATSMNSDQSERSVTDESSGEKPTITYVNDNPAKPNPNPNDLTPGTRSIVEDTVSNTGYDINVNSGFRSESGPRHGTRQAVDINRIDGKRVDDPSNFDKVKDFQEALNSHPNVRENFGPSLNTKTLVDGTRVDRPDMAEGHKDHIHVSVQK